MPKDGNITRLKILEETTGLVYRNGFSGTTIDHILERTQITKGAFFYHFKNKADLAKQLIQHFSESDLRMLEETKAAALKSSTDPREQLLTFVQVHINHFEKLKKPHSGCLYATYISEPDQFDEDIKQIVTRAILEWRKELAIIIQKAVKQKKNSDPVHVDSLADMFTVILEGAFITAKALKDSKLTVLQLRHYKKYLELLL